MFPKWGSFQRFTMLLSAGVLPAAMGAVGTALGELSLDGSILPRCRPEPADPLPGFGDRFVGQADDVKGGQAGGDDNLCLDFDNVDALKRDTSGAQPQRSPPAVMHNLMSASAAPPAWIAGESTVRR